MSLGALIKGMVAMRLDDPQPAEPFEGYSIMAIKNAVDNLQMPNYSQSPHPGPNSPSVGATAAAAVNTNSTKSAGLFASGNTNPTNSAGLFGSVNTNSTNSAGFFVPGNTNPTNSTGLFGNTNSTNSARVFASVKTNSTNSAKLFAPVSTNSTNSTKSLDVSSKLDCGLETKTKLIIQLQLVKLQGLQLEAFASQILKSEALEMTESREAAGQ